jgi:hypothetical protein
VGPRLASGIVPQRVRLRISDLPAPQRREADLQRGYVVDAGELVGARVVKAPFLHTLRPRDEDVSLVLEAAGKTFEIEGRTTMSTFMAMPTEINGGLQLQQAFVRYSFNGETAVGMLERSITPDQISA